MVMRIVEDGSPIIVEVAVSDRRSASRDNANARVPVIVINSAVIDKEAAFCKERCCLQA